MATKKRKKTGTSAREKARAARRERSKGRVGRPSLFTPERTEKLLQALQLGAYKETAAGYAGISYSTLYDWLTQGQAEIDAGADPDRPMLNAEDHAANPDDVAPIYQPCETFAQFVKAVADAEAGPEVRNVALIQEAAQGTWQAAAWWLERKFPGRWGSRKQVEVGGATSPGAVPIGIKAEVDVEVRRGVIILPPEDDEGGDEHG